MSNMQTNIKISTVDLQHDILTKKSKKLDFEFAFPV